MPPRRLASRYVALLRAINVGGHTVRMEDLRALFVEMGFADVESVIASGNVLFSSRSGTAATVETKIERALASALGYEVTTFIRQREELEAVVKVEALSQMSPAAEDHVLSVAFLKRAPDPDAVRALLALRNDVDDFLVRGREVFWLRRTRQQAGQVAGPRFERTLRLSATVRNITTVRKLSLKA